MTGPRPAPNGRLVIFEGPDGVGKSTISTAVAHELQRLGQDCLLMTFPGREPGTLGRLVYEVHHDPARFDVQSLSDAGRQALHIAAHLDAIDRRILPTLRRGVHVLLDRYWWSTWVYGRTGGVDPVLLRRLIEVEIAAWVDAVPTVALLLRHDAPINRDHDLSAWRELRAEYDRLAKRERRRHPVTVIENSGVLGDVIARVLAAIFPYLDPGSHDGGAKPTPPTPGQLELAFPRQTGLPRAAPEGPLLFSPIAPARPSKVYDTYWRFAAERQAIFFRRMEGAPPPWTDDPVLARYKFTNAYRASDRVSQFLIRHVIYRDDLPLSTEEVFFRILLFKLFNKIETYTLLEREIGPPTAADYRFERYDAVLSEAMRSGRRIYSAAYIMPSGRGAFGEVAKHRNHLRLLELMLAEELPARIAGASTMQRGFELLRDYPTIGDFLAYQLVTDLNYSALTDWPEMEFVVPGPGARDGLRKCFAELGGLSEAEMIRFVADRQETEFARLGLHFRSLWGRPLQLIDCQNLFCEVDKYARVVHPEVAGLSGRTRIKQRFVARPALVNYWYPPKWGINAAVQETHDVSISIDA